MGNQSATANRADVIVLGGGTMGTAAAWALARRGFKSLLLEQFQHVHAMGSHGGDTRIIRHAYAESPEYVPLVLRADELWQELESETGDRVLVRCGGLELAAPGFRHARNARMSADEHDIPYEWLSPSEASSRWPAFTIPDDWDALYTPSSGFLLTEPALRGMADQAVRLGATLLEHTPATGWGSENGSVWVDTESGRYEADALIVTAGAWAGKLLSLLGLPVHVRRKTLWWQEVDNPERYHPHQFPVFITDSQVGGIYGFPIFETPGLKIANHEGGDVVDLAHVDRETHPGENRDCLALASRILPGVRSPVVKSVVCLYTMTPDTDFIIDRVPQSPNVVFGAGFSGHGFKFAPAIGELLAAMVTDPGVAPIPRLGLSRFNSAASPVPAE